jgi:hypothetical protein
LALYTFFLRRADGDATSFEIHDLANDAAACDLAAHVSAQHPSSAYVEVFLENREVLTLARARQPA